MLGKTLERPGIPAIDEVRRRSTVVAVVACRAEAREAASEGVWKVTFLRARLDRTLRARAGGA
jgi:hypothetical protein